MKSTIDGHQAAPNLPAVKIVVWQEDDAWLGYFQEFPDYWTQGKNRADLQRHLRDLYRDLTDGQIPGIRRVEELVIS